MTRIARPVLHGRDHEWGGADPVRIVWESVGGGGSGGFPVGSYYISRTIPSSDAGINRHLNWAYSLGDHLLDLTDVTVPLIIDAGVYSYQAGLAPNVALATGESAFLEFTANDALSGLPGGNSHRTFQTSEATAGSSSSVYLDASFVMFQDAGSSVYATVTSLASALSLVYSGFGRIQRIL